MTREELKEVVAALWQAGHKKEAAALVRMAGVSKKEALRQYKIITRVLSDLDIRSEVAIEPGKNEAYFTADVDMVSFGSFVQRFLTNLNAEGTRKYEIKHIDRNSNPTKITIKF